ncbi:hypothetical protein V497_08112 [Pseudogymnoascus sp. VKM F-4516 (FW-969)]|nr:hypothetical protein V497_08112 [Pseudogymnoascus sp. VKM F-4516 (FW-969)]
MRLDVSGRPLSLFQQNCVTRSRAETKRDCLANILYIISARRSFFILVPSRSAAGRPQMAAGPSGGSPEYEELVGILNSRLSTGPLGIQILPDASALTPGSLVEIVDNTLGIPKVVLAKAFIAARRIFFKNLDNLTENAGLILDSTSVILLFDPEHITAANARKRICLACRTRSQTEQVKRLKDELWFTQFLLTSKLKRHNKSPTLWSHRKWLIKNFNTLEGLLGPKWVEYEIEDVILRSAEHHPKNYYAWDYMRWWIQSRPGLDTTRWSREVNVPLAMLMQAWCLHHTSDSSGWSFLTWIHKSPESNSLEGQQLVAAAGKKVLDCAVSMDLKNPSLWKFLQDILGCTTTSALSEVRFEYIGQLQKMRSSEPRGSTMQKFGENSLLHIYAYENPPDYD